jgi:hypothetical protein
VSAGHASLGATLGTSENATRTEDVQEVYKREKIEFLLRHIMEYQQMFRDIAAVSGGDSYLFLDDLYQIGRSDQPGLFNALN